MAIETTLRLYADTLLGFLRFRVYDQTKVRSILRCGGMQCKNEVEL